MTASDLTLNDLDYWRGRLCLWVSVSRKFTYIVHIGRYRGSAYVKETGTSSRFHDVQDAWADIAEGLDENNS